MIIPFTTKTPRIGSGAFIAPSAWVTGDVSIGDEASVFFGAVLRGDLMPIHIGRQSNIQDQVIIHTSHLRCPTIVADRVTVGHRAILHGCQIEGESMIGMGAIVLDEAVVGSQSLVGAGAVVPERMQIPPRSLVLGIPARVVRELTDEEVANIQATTERYLGIAKEYIRQVTSL